nr:hypothetical protein pPsy0462a_00055 [Pseudomonas syringae]
MRSLIDGAGAVGKAPDLTFNQDQVDAGMAYMKNSARHDGGGHRARAISSRPRDVSIRG